jgi:hypothetical protein
MLNNHVPLIHQEILRGNAWARTARLVSIKDRVPLILAPGTLVLMQIRAKRGRNNPILKELSIANGGIFVGTNGYIIINGFTGRDTFLISAETLVGELVIGPQDNLMIPYLTIIFQFKDAVTIPTSVST